MSRSCQSATFSRAASALLRTRRARPHTCSHDTGFRLWGIALEPFCPSPKGSSASRISVRWSERISSATFSSDAAAIASAPAELGVPVALHDLGRDRRGLEAEQTAHLLLDVGVDVGKGPHRTRDLPDAHRLARPSQPL